MRYSVVALMSVLAGSLGSSIALGEPEIDCGVEHESSLLNVEAVSIQDDVIRGGGVCPGCVIEVHVLVDKALFDTLGSGTQSFVDDVITGMDAVWSKPLGEGGMELGIELSETTIFFGGDPWPQTTDSFVLVNEVSDFVNANFPIDPDGRDTVLLLSGLDFDLGVGVGTVGTLCRTRSVAIAEATTFPLDAVIAIANHQLGHNVGTFHDGSANGNLCDANDFLMGLFSLSSPPTSFSSCSIGSMIEYILNPKFDVLAGLGSPVGPCAADLNGDGVLNFFDVSEFIQSFSAGCP